VVAYFKTTQQCCVSIGTAARLEYGTQAPVQISSK